MAFTMPVILLVLQRSFGRRRQPLRVAMACSPRQRILGVAAVVKALPSLQAAAPERDSDESARSLVRLAHPAFQLSFGQRFDDPVGPCGGQVVDGPGRGDAHNSWPNRSVRTWTFMP